MKKTILILSMLGAIYFLWFKFALNFTECNRGASGFVCNNVNWLELLFNLSPFLFVLFIFSLGIYLLPDRVFIAWWKFARFAIPLSVAALTYIILGLHHGPNPMWEGFGDIYILALIYLVFILGSFIQIIRGYLRK